MSVGRPFPLAEERNKPEVKSEQEIFNLCEKMCKPKSILADIIYNNAHTAHVKAQTEGQEQNNRIIAVEADKAENMAMTKEEAQALSKALYDAARQDAWTSEKESYRRMIKVKNEINNPARDGLDWLNQFSESLPSLFKIK